MKAAVILDALTGALAFGVPSAWAQSTVPGDATQRRIQTLEDQVRALQAELAALRTFLSQTSASPPATLPPAAAAAPTPSPTDAPAPPAQPGPTGAGSQGAGNKMFNPDIGMIGNFLGAAGASRGGTPSLAPIKTLTLQESEASFQAIIDPYARADFFLAIGEQGIEVEEGFMTFTALPGGLLLKAGKMRANFGRLNAFHNHTLPWIDRPLVMYNLLGGETGDPDTGIKDAGLSVSKLIPAGGLFLEATGEVFRGDSGSLYQANRRADASVVAHLRAYGDFTENSNLEVATSYSRGHNDLGSAFTTTLYGTDITYRWRPLMRAIYHSFAGRTELIWSRREQLDGVQRAFGFYASGDYQLGAALVRRWPPGLVGARARGDAARSQRVRGRDLLAVRVLTAPHAVPAFAVRRRPDRQRTDVSGAVYHWCAWRASFLKCEEMSMRTAAVAALVLAIAVPASAHVRVTPRESKPGAKETYTLRVPTEGQVATTSVVLDVPDSVTIESASAPDGATSELTRQNNRVTQVTWTIEIKPGAAAELGFVAQNPATGSEIMWPMHQKYADGKSSEWIGAAGSRAPAPVTKLTTTPGATAPAAGQGADGFAAIVQWLAAYDQALNAKDLTKLATFYHPDVTIYEGGGINKGWVDYRDNHIGPELKGFENLTFSHSNVQARMLEGGKSAYVTSEYSLKARAGTRDVDSGGLETLVLVQDATGAWKIRHSHTSAKRRAPAGGAPDQR